MQHIFQTAKRLISMCVVTLLLVTSTLTILPASARAEGNIVVCNAGIQRTIKQGRALAKGAGEVAAGLAVASRSVPAVSAARITSGATGTLDAIAATATGAGAIAHGVAVTAAEVAQTANVVASIPFISEGVAAKAAGAGGIAHGVAVTAEEVAGIAHGVAATATSAALLLR